MKGLAANDVWRQLVNTSEHIYVALKTTDRRLGTSRKTVTNVIKNQHADLAIQQLLD